MGEAAGEMVRMDREGKKSSVLRVDSAELAVVAPKPSLFPTTELAEVAFAGRSNVGKSSLINKLCARKKLAYTSGTPGKTRKVFYFLINKAFHFVDLPGYGYAKIPKTERAYFKVLVDAYLKDNANLRACVLLLDPRRPVGEEEISFVHYLNTIFVPAIVVFTKWDRVRSSDRAGMLKKRKSEFAGAAKTILTTSSKSGAGMDQLWRLLRKHLGPLGESTKQEVD